jgi:hypothetical protein
MSKIDDKIEELEKWKNEKAIEDGIRKGLTKWMHTICMTATSTIVSGFYFLGGFLYTHWGAFEAAIKAWLSAERGGQ